MSATLREVRLHHQQISAMLAGIQQLMDGQAALGEAVEALKKREQNRCLHQYAYDLQSDGYVCGICGHRVFRPRLDNIVNG